MVLGSDFRDAFALGVISTITIASALYIALASPSSSPPRQSYSPIPGAESRRRTARLATGIDLADDIIREQLTRNIQFFGESGQKRITESRVVVVGLGGVGSHAAHLLLRSGVGQLRLIDFDQVTLSSLNRHALAVRADVGLPKATVLAGHFHEISPETHVEAVVAMYSTEAEERLLGGEPRPDYVLDAIDNIDTKVSLLAACKRRGIPVLCVGGAGAKADPTRLRFVDIAEASTDPLARAVRHRLRRRHGVTGDLPVLLSTEKPRCGLVTTEEQDQAPSMLDYQTIPNFRIRTIPVLGTAPAIFGMAAASWILCQLAGAPYVPEPAFRIYRPQYDTILEELHSDEAAAVGHCDDVAVDLEEVAFLVSSLWRGVSAHKQGRGELARDKALHRRTAGLRLVRFDARKPAVPGNLVLLSDEEADELRRMGHEAWERAYPEAARFVRDTLQKAADVFDA